MKTRVFVQTKDLPFRKAGAIWSIGKDPAGYYVSIDGANYSLIDWATSLVRYLDGGFTDSSDLDIAGEWFRPAVSADAAKLLKIRERQKLEAEKAQLQTKLKEITDKLKEI